MKHSESIKNISYSMLEIQRELKNPAQTAENPFYKSKYTPLNDLLDMIRPVCNKHNCSIIQEDSKEGVSTMLLHESGEWLQQEPMPMSLEKATPQGAGNGKYHD